jgi:uncharacterized protein YjiK
MGIVFLYDTRKGEIIRQIPFSGNGDYEGITLVDNTLYVLRSDGILYELSDYRVKSPLVKIYDTGIPAKDNEGICYDSMNKRLLIACKQGYKDNKIKHRQLIYSFNLKTGKLSEDPVIVIDIKLLQMLVKENDIKIPGIDKDHIDKLDFRASEIGINPLNGKIFLISAPDNAMMVTDMNGKVETITPLKKDLFRQPEGITFNGSGDLFISNEGAGKKPTLIRFNYIKTASTATNH